MAETGFVQAFKWDEQLAEPSYNSGGLVVGGSMPIASPDSRRLGIGAQAAWSAGVILPAVAPEVLVTSATKPLIQYALRASYPAGALTAIMAHVGTDAHDWLLENALIRSLSLSGSPEDALRARFDIAALMVTKGTAGAEEPAVGTLLDWYHGAVTIGDNPYDCRSFDAVINNNVRVNANLDAKTPTEARFPGGFSLGTEEVSLRVSLGTYLAYDILADDPARDVDVDIVYTDGVTTVTLTFTDLAVVGGMTMPFQAGGDDVLWDLELQGAPGCLGIT